MVVRASLPRCHRASGLLRKTSSRRLEADRRRGPQPLTRSRMRPGDRRPGLLVHNSAYHLYYGRRSGARWTVEKSVQRMLLWRALGRSLGASGAGLRQPGRSKPEPRFRSRPDRPRLGGRRRLVPDQHGQARGPFGHGFQHLLTGGLLGTDVEVIASSRQEPPPAEPAAKPANGLRALSRPSSCFSS